MKTSPPASGLAGPGAPALLNALDQKLNNLLGAARAAELRTELLNELGLEVIESPDDRLRFGNALIARGGLLEAVGRSIKVQALLHGAREQ